MKDISRLDRAEIVLLVFADVPKSMSTPHTGGWVLGLLLDWYWARNRASWY
jgi:hypothetical protein